MPGIDIASSCSSLLTPAEEYLRYPTYGEHIGSTTFDLCDADDTLLAHQHGACSWAERDAHAGALAAVAATEAAAEARENGKGKARVRDRRRREKAGTVDECAVAAALH